MSQYGRKKGVLLETVAPPAPVHEFGLEDRQVEPDGPAEQHVHIFERYGPDVGGVERGKGLEGGFVRSGVSDPLEVGVQIQAVRCRHESSRCVNLRSPTAANGWALLRTRRC